MSFSIIFDLILSSDSLPLIVSSVYSDIDAVARSEGENPLALNWMSSLCLRLTLTGEGEKSFPFDGPSTS